MIIFFFSLALAMLTYSLVHRTYDHAVTYIDCKLCLSNCPHVV